MSNASVQVAGEGDPRKEMLPPLRLELSITKGAPYWTGAPSYLIHDPVRNKYVRIGSEDLKILSHWNTVDPAHFAAELSHTLNRNISVEEVTDFAKFLITNYLTVKNGAGEWKQFLEQHNSSKQSLWKKAVHSYLFFRIPLLDPQQFLSATWPFIGFLFTPSMAKLFTLLGLFSLYLVSLQWSIFQSTFMDFLSIDGFLCYGASLVFIKVFHELGHAFMAHKYKVRVPTIGAAFIVLMPILYTDTTGAHSLVSRRQKLNIDLAGLYAELALASIATFIWIFLPDGPLRSVAFATATLSWVLSLAVNLNPFMRFDGYYILSDLTGFENLQDRSFALAKWKMRELLFGLGIPPPEALPKSWHLPIIMHAWGTWIYRLFLFLGIALVVYAFFIKIIGIALFVIEILWFILMPVVKELKHWWELRIMIVKSKRGWISFACACLFVAFIFVPWENKVAMPAVLKMAGTAQIFPPKSAQLASLTMPMGSIVKQGQTLAVLTSPDLLEEKQRILRQIELLHARLARYQDNVEDLSLRLVLQNELAGKQTELIAIENQFERLIIRAPVTGQLVDSDPSLGAGMWINPSFKLVSVKPEHSGMIIAYGDEISLMRIKDAAKGMFVPQNYQLPAIEVLMDKKALISSPVLHDEILADLYGGPVSVSFSQDETNLRTVLKPHQTHFKLELKITEPLAAEFKNQIVAGMVHMEAGPQSYASRIGNRIAMVFIREFGL